MYLVASVCPWALSRLNNCAKPVAQKLPQPSVVLYNVMLYDGNCHQGRILASIPLKCFLRLIFIEIHVYPIILPSMATRVTYRGPLTTDHFYNERGFDKVRRNGLHAMNQLSVLSTTCLVVQGYFWTPEGISALSCRQWNARYIFMDLNNAFCSSVVEIDPWNPY